MDKPFKIYALIDPLTNEVRYVGRTVALFGVRLSGHVSEAKTAIRRRTPRENLSPKVRWLVGLLELGHRPDIQLLERAIDANEAEHRWIVKLRKEGVSLLNDVWMHKDVVINTEELEKFVNAYDANDTTGIESFVAACRKRIWSRS